MKALKRGQTSSKSSLPSSSSSNTSSSSPSSSWIYLRSVLYVVASSSPASCSSSSTDRWVSLSFSILFDFFSSYPVLVHLGNYSVFPIHYLSAAKMHLHKYGVPNLKKKKGWRKKQNLIFVFNFWFFSVSSFNQCFFIFKFCFLWS